jgi:hypothetical protein
VSPAVNTCKKSSEFLEDLFGGLGPDERPGVLVPRFDPGPHVGLEGLDGPVVAALEQISGDVPEEPFD